MLRVIALAIARAFAHSRPRSISRSIGAFIGVAVLYLAIIATGIGLAYGINRALARDDGRFAGSPLKEWFDHLASGKGLCCSFADGKSISDVDWDTRDGHYRVRIAGAWIDVPKSAVVDGPNKYGPAVVWPYLENGRTAVRCFMPGSGA